MLLPRWPRVVATTALCLSIPLVSTTSAWAAPAPTNTSPTISDLTDRSNPEDTPEGPIPFTIGDAESGAETLRLTAISSNPSLVPVSGIRLGGTYSNRTVTVVPAANQSGTATITITVSDGSLSRSDSFVQTIRPENDRPTISDVANRTATSGRASSPIAVTLADVDNTVSSLTLTARSSNTTLVPATGLVLGGSGANRTLTLTPAAGQTGSATITLTASDGVLTATDTFTVTVTAPVPTTTTTTTAPPPPTTTTTAPAPTTTTTAPTGGTNTRPTISDLTDRSNPEDVPEGPISFNVGDAQTAAGSLTVRGTSSNTTLIPNAGITFGGSGGNRTVTVAPAANQSGTATITITVSDGSLSTSDTFVQTIRPENDTPTISNITNRTTSMGTATGDIPFVVGDAETSASQLTVTGTSNAALVPVSAIDLGGSGANRTIEVTPAAGQTGTATITVGASDGTITATDAFTLTVSGSGTTTTTTAPPPPTTTTTTAPPPPTTTTTTAPPPPTTTTTAPPPPTTTTTTAPAPPSAPAGVFASPTGNGSGTASSPASLASVLNGTVRVNEGQTIWLRGGTYTGRFTSNLNGTSSARITIRSYPGETAVINSTNGQGGDVLIVSGSYTDVRDLEVMMSDTNRYPWRDAGITVQGHHNRVINNYIHDTGCGITSFSSATDVTIYGNIILNVGSGNASESCHSIYAANSTGTKIIEDNIWWGSGWFGLHLYTEGGSLRGFQIRGNVGAGPNLIGGFAPLDQIDVDDNDFDHLQIGYGADQNGSVNVRNNRLGWSPDGRALSVFRLYDQLTVTGNTMYGHTSDGVRFENSAGVAPSSNATWNGNTYYRLGFAYPTSPGEWPCCGESFGTWRNDHPSWDTSGSSWNSGAPANSLTINPNQFEAGRATVVAHTYNGASTVSVNPSSFLTNGARYVVLNAFNPKAAPVASGTYSGGSISLPTSLSTASPIGMPVDSNPTPITSIYVIRTVS